MTDPPQIARQLLEIMPLIGRVLAADLRGSDHIPAHFRLLGMLCFKRWSLSELAEKQAVSLPTMSASISTLEERGWVHRTPSPEDRRVVLVEVTETGRAEFERVFTRSVDRLARLLETLSEEDRQKLLDGLAVLRRVFAQAGDVSPPG